MIHHIDLSSVLRRTVCDLYSNLVTRSTGAAVRTEIEHLLADARTPSLTVIDFSHVNLLDFSCADEVVAKLLLRFRADVPLTESYFLVRGAKDVHLDAIETALERHDLALVVEGDGGRPLLGGRVDAGLRAAWESVARRGGATAGEVAGDLAAPEPAVRAVLDAAHVRRLLMRFDELYTVPVGVVQ